MKVVVSCRGKWAAKTNPRCLFSCFSPLLDRLQLLAVFLRVAHDFAFREAVDPLIVRNRAAFAASASRSAVQHIRGSLGKNSENVQRELRDSVMKSLYAGLVRKNVSRRKK